MKLKKTLPDGTVIEVEGDPQEIRDWESGKKNEAPKPKKKVLHGKAPEMTEAQFERLMRKLQEETQKFLPPPMPQWPPNSTDTFTFCIHESDNSTVPSCKKCGAPMWLQPLDSHTITVGCVHDFPNPWFGVQPPSCRKCGQQAMSVIPTVFLSTNQTRSGCASGAGCGVSWLLDVPLN